MPSRRQEDALLLGALFEARPQALPAPTLARQAGMPVSELEQRLAPYIEAGYPIEFHPRGTVSLGDVPDVWCAEEILGRCPPAADPLPKWEPLVLAETGSTNDVAREQGRLGAPGGFLAVASRQTSGRGRLGRTWESPPDRGVYVSILLRPRLRPAEAGRLTIQASLAAADAIEAVSCLRPQIKWPNDLMLGGRKLGGLLIETEPRGGWVDFAVMGIGLNVNHEANDFSETVRSAATSVLMATGQRHRRADVLVALLKAFERRLAEPFTAAREAWSASSLTLGQRVELVTARGRRLGQAMGLDDSGALLLRDEAGTVEAITAGDMQPA